MINLRVLREAMPAEGGAETAAAGSTSTVEKQPIVQQNGRVICPYCGKNLKHRDSYNSHRIAVHSQSPKVSVDSLLEPMW
jgi:hypothetical protein